MMHGMDGLRQIGKEITTYKGAWRVAVALAATFLVCFGGMGLATLLMIGGLNEYIVVGGMFIVIVLFMHPKWADFCEGMVDSFDRAGSTLDFPSYINVGSLLIVTITTRAFAVPLTPPRLHLA